jgi:hypothetical protein
VPKFFLRFAGFALAVCAVAIAPLASTARAQTTTVPVTFNGTVSISASDTVSIRQADGSYAAYTGSLPAFPYQDGQAVSISFNATVPSAAWYAANPSAAAMTQAADGVYRITLYSDTSGLAGLMIPGIGTGSAADVSGGIDAAANPRTGGTSVLALTLLYNANTNSYSIAPGSSFVAAIFRGRAMCMMAPPASLRPARAPRATPQAPGPTCLAWWAMPIIPRFRPSTFPFSIW